MSNRRYIDYASNTTIKTYFSDVRKTVLLTPEEEIEVAKKIQNGCEESVQKLVMANLKIVISIAKEYQNQGVDVSDLINEGNYGLLKAAKKFDYTKGFKFISYAVWWVRQSIIQCLNENARTVRLPVNLINKINKINKEYTSDEINFIESEDEHIKKYSTKTPYYLNDLFSYEGDEYVDMLEGDSFDLSDEENKVRVRKRLYELFSCLNDREREIIEDYFGFNSDYECFTLEEIGEKFNLTKERVRQIKERAIRKLRYNANDLHLLMVN